MWLTSPIFYVHQLGRPADRIGVRSQSPDSLAALVPAAVSKEKSAQLPTRGGRSISGIDLGKVQNMNDGEAYAALYRGSPVRRSKFSGMKRNAAALLGCSALFVLFYGAVHADTVYLKNGRKLEGIVKSETDKAEEIEVGFGTVKLAR